MTPADAAKRAKNIVKDWYSDPGYLKDEIAKSLIDTHNAAIEEAAKFVEGGRFLHDEAPTAIFGRECSAGIRRTLTIKDAGK